MRIKGLWEGRGRQKGERGGEREISVSGSLQGNWVFDEQKRNMKNNLRIRESRTQSPGLSSFFSSCFLS